ncbi:hypothetical protein QFX18_05295 [Saccharophagus degradans]|uniref:hypothetical protein n=1 Tax=Saccharophagus degradans TaxID=86304 RepID=UPI0024782E8E|nr:hypothetical protein [Saccharophagus degradans]WGO99476.1 hypothetical protein QFX18_05295 [Saccharophagus degradans]
MKIFQYLYKVITIIFTLLCIWLVFVGLATGNFVQVGVGVVVCFLLWVGSIKASKGNRQGIVISCGIAGLLSLPMAYRLIQRVVFVLENGGMERADGYGSALAFIIGLSFESLLFIPLFGLFLVGAWYLVRSSFSHA